MVNTKYEPADIEIYLKNQGLVRKEKSLIAYQESDGKFWQLAQRQNRLQNSSKMVWLWYLRCGKE